MRKAAIMELNRDNLLSNDKAIFQYYIPEWKEGKNFISPLRNENSPSASIKYDNGRYYFKDFGSGETRLNAIDFVMKKDSLDFKDALQKINQDLGLGLNGKSSFTPEVSFTEELKSYEYDFLKQSGITREVCQLLNVVSIDWHTGESKDGKIYKIHAKPDDFIIGYRIGENTFKTYRPLNKQYKFSWIGIKPVNYVFGYNQLPATGESVFIAAGEKDALTLISHSYPAICTSSEAVEPTPELITDLKARFKNIIVVYDLDDTGKKQSEKICSKYGLKNFKLPEDLFIRGIGKDVTDFFKAQYTFEYSDFIQTDTFNNILEETLRQDVTGTINYQENKITHSFYELWSNRNEETPLLIPDLLPAFGLVMLLGEDGIGKTQIARQQLLQIVFRKTSFIDQSINIRHGRGMFIATEDSAQDFIKAAKKQVYGLGCDHAVTPDLPIDFIEGTNFDDFKQLLSEIERLLKASQYDLIVIDALSDLFTLVNGEINSNSHARQILNPLQALANKHQVLIMILHHASKSAMKNKRERGQILVEKNDCQGASAITQKPRTVLALSNDPAENVNYLHIVKANGLPRRFKETAIKMKFNEETLLHEFEDYSGVFDSMNSSTGKRSNLTAPEISPEIHDQILSEIFKMKPEHGYKELYTAIKEVYNKSFGKIGDNKAKDFITFYNLNGYLLKSGSGKYYRKLSV